MKEEFKIYWKLYEEYYSTDELLKNFTNYIDLYLTNENAHILDIGCGQSSYLLDFYKNSSHNLYACDTEIIQIEALKRRIKNIKSNANIEYSTQEFPNSDFKDLNFTAVIVSNLLHFMNLEEAKEFIKNIEKQINKESLLLFTVHSWRHNSNGDFSYFKHYFKKTDFYKILPKTKYEYLYYEQKSAEKYPKQVEFIKKWIRLVVNQKGITNENHIKKIQSDYLKKSANTDNITVVLRKR